MTLAAALVDFGGTLFPDRSPHLDAHDEPRVNALVAEFKGLEPATAQAIVTDLDRQAEVIADQDWQDTNAVLIETFTRLAPGIEHFDVDVARTALCVPMSKSDLFDGAPDFLAGIKGLGLRCVLVSNTYMRDHDDYMSGLEDLGLAQYFDGLVSSVDTQWRKPSPEIFKVALKAAGCDSGACVMIGDSETKDIAPAKALGMRALKIAITVPPDAPTVADAVATTLAQASGLLAGWVKA